MSARYYLEIAAASEEAIDAAMIERLRARGFEVADASAKWERCCDFVQRLGLKGETVIRKLNDPRCPAGVEVRRSRKGAGRRSHIKSTPAFEAFCLERKP